MLTSTAMVVALLLTGSQPGARQVAEVDELASKSLAQGRALSAIRSLEREVEAEPDDPALLINLGIAYAQAGSVETARALFERALVSPEPIQLETADGRVVDSRRLARKAMRMLERGEFTARLTRLD